MRNGAWLSPSASATSFMAVVRALMSEMRLIFERCNACCAFCSARSSSCLLLPLAGVPIETAPPRSRRKYCSRSSARAGITDTSTCLGTGAIGSSRSARPVCSRLALRALVDCARDDASPADMRCVDPMAVRCSSTLICAFSMRMGVGSALTAASSVAAWAIGGSTVGLEDGGASVLLNSPASRSLYSSEYTCMIRSLISSASSTSSMRSTLQLRSPRIEPERTKNACTDASSSSDAMPNTSASTS